jgi:hypothetical protein
MPLNRPTAAGSSIGECLINDRLEPLCISMLGAGHYVKSMNAIRGWPAR